LTPETLSSNKLVFLVGLLIKHLRRA